MACILSTRDLGVRFGQFVANRGINLNVQAHSIHSLIGPNGAGKTTFFNALSGRLLPAEGSVTFDGRDVTRMPVNRRVRIGMARCFQVTNLFQGLTTRENLRLAAQGMRPGKALNFWSRKEHIHEASETADELIERLSLQKLAHTKVSELSHGRQRMLEVAMSLASRPKLLLLDEPTSGMGVDDIPMMRELLQNLSSDHTILLVEHNMHLVMSVSHRIAVLYQGELLVEGTPDDIRGDERVRRVYLGERKHA
ncbi:MAG: ABC transporter ATP-binding protein [Burkholderiaceae bacterium]|jgi:branched-chain amino acid transport system ATP-binding protein|nr:ABC transporter ATP-binding protein [Burkholderiaceae bacterium]